MSGGGSAVGTGNTLYDHEITVICDVVCRDGRTVRIKASRKNQDCVIGCTRVTRAAIEKIFEMTKRVWDNKDEVVLQDY